MVLLPGLLSLSSPEMVMATEPQFHGYLSQAAIRSTDNPYFDDESGTNFNFREIGLNLAWSATDQLRLAGQVLSRKAGDLEDGDPSIDFLLVDYNFLATEELSAGIRLGRVKSPYGIYNTTRDVPHGRPGIFVPQSVYFESTRGAILSSDGGNFYLSNTNSVADFNFDLFGGKVSFDNAAVEYQIYQTDMPGKIEGGDLGGIRLEILPKAMPDLTVAVTTMDIQGIRYEDAPVLTPAERLSAAVTLANDPSQYADFITSMKIDVFMMLYSLQYEWRDLIFTTEYLDIDIDIHDFEVIHLPLPDREVSLLGYYFQTEWLVSNRYSVYARYEELYYNKDDKSGKEFAELTGGNPVTQYNKALTLGARWYYTPDFSLTAELSRNTGAAFINGQANIDYSALKEDWNLLMLQVAYHF